MRPEMIRYRTDNYQIGTANNANIKMVTISGYLDNL